MSVARAILLLLAALLLAGCGGDGQTYVPKREASACVRSMLVSSAAIEASGKLALGDSDAASDAIAEARAKLEAAADKAGPKPAVAPMIAASRAALDDADAAIEAGNADRLSTIGPDHLRHMVRLLDGRECQPLKQAG
jgi:hypothetical protein